MAHNNHKPAFVKVQGSSGQNETSVTGVWRKLSALELLLLIVFPNIKRYIRLCGIISTV